ncbi:RING finger domain protein [Blumeria hordei DH14]|uniref:RING finger domain protein n=1 Tax=Blumeria graminis f. sp. hordei (strain DH14) TaxID=546991 RepID=N1JLS9_BLUG1|nr:RING finger domain protein [Blumeria hordei DH14]
MAVMNLIVSDLVNIVGRQIHARQEDMTATSSTSQSTGNTADPALSPSQTSMTGQQPTGGPTSSPLLFFVALGFGVVFTNLWIIVGVKYCFRYNARNRAIRNGDDADNINLDNMHNRPHRRRREKKLMTMDEVNERFPLTKYKSWVASRAREGLPTTGGVSMHPSTAPSIIHPENSATTPPISPTAGHHDEIKQSELDKTGSTKPSPPALAVNVDTQISEKDVHSHSREALNPNDLDPTSKLPKDQQIHRPNAASNDEEDEEEDQINAAAVSELLSGPGDSCAICIDTLEEEDEIRGLSCGHAFHAGCLDPWLTSRRACCPLCKADYYTPKTRPEAEEIEMERPTRRRVDRTHVSPQSPSLWNSIRAASRLIRPRHGDINSSSATTRGTQPSPGNVSDNVTTQTSLNNTHHEMNQLPQPDNHTSNLFRNIHLPRFPLHRHNRQAVTEISASNPVSPSQLEEGIHR